MAALHLRPWLIFNGAVGSHAILLVEKDITDREEVRSLAISRLYPKGTEYDRDEMGVLMLPEMPNWPHASANPNPDMYILDFEVSEPYVEFKGLA